MSMLNCVENKTEKNLSEYYMQKFTEICSLKWMTQRNCDQFIEDIFEFNSIATNREIFNQKLENSFQ